MSDFKKLQRRLDKARNAKERYEAFEDLAEYQFKRGEFEDALKFYKEELDAAQELQDEGKIAKGHRMIGEVLLELSLYDEALEHTNKYYEYAKASNRLVEQQRALTTLGRTYMVKADSLPDRGSAMCTKVYRLAMKRLWESLIVCKELENGKVVPASEIYDMRARSMLNLGHTYDGLNQWEDAEEQFTLAVRMCKAHHLEGSLLRRCYMSLASLLIRQGKSEEAFRYYKDAESTVKSLPDDERKEAIVDIHLGESEALTLLGDIHSARKVLQKAYKSLGRTALSCSETVTSRLKIVAGIEFTQRKIDRTPDMSIEEKSRLYESIGDGFTKVGAYKHALDYYKKMLQCCEAVNFNLRECYFSLAQTCKDLKQYRDAISYFEQELLHCTPESACSTLLLINECEALMEAPASVQLKSLRRALDMAEKANDQNLKRKVLKRLEQVQQQADSPEVAETKLKIEALGDCTSDSEEEDDSQQCTPTIGGDIDLDALSDSSCEDIEEDLTANESIPAARPRRNPHRIKQAASKRNEKGETKLHVACINNKINAVRTLLKQGCDVNATDNVGWTPLHEACNLGHTDIIEVLLENGADINQKGPEGITPLHDAAQGGNLDVMEYLLDRNASALMLTDKGETLLDTLMSYYKRAEGTLTPEEKMQFNCLHDRIQAYLKEAEPLKSTSNPSQKLFQSSPRIDGNKSSLNRFPGSLRRSLGDDEIDPLWKRSKRDISPVSSLNSSSSSVCSDVSNKVNDEGEEGVSEYVKAIQSVRKNNLASNTPEPVRKPLQPLVDENEVVDNWLEDDIMKQPSKKRKKCDQNTSSLSNSYRPLSVKKKSTSRLSLNSCSSRASSIGSTEAREETRRSTGSVHSDAVNMSAPLMDWDEEGVQMYESHNQNADDYWTNNISSSTMKPWPSLSSLDLCQSPLTVQNVSHLATSSNQVLSQQVAPPPPNRVNVRVEGRLLAVPVHDLSLSIGWLAKEAAKRYKVDGCIPRLSIYLSDGAAYSEDDTIANIIGEDVVGRIDSWDIPLITNRYRDACQFLATSTEENILSLLEECQETHAIEIADNLYPTHVLKPVFRAMSMEFTLSKINLSNNMLNDEGVTDLCEHLGKLNQLKELDLSGNNISVLGLKELVKAAKKGYFKTLLDLNLSHNYLTDAGSPCLVELTASTPELECLSLVDCMFTKSIAPKSPEFLTLNNVRSLDLSSNELHAEGLAWFLGISDFDKERCLNPERLQYLSLLGLKGKFLSLEVLKFLNKGSSVALREFHLSYSALKEEDLTPLLSLMWNASELHTFRIPAALNISVECICRLLLHEPPLKSLEIHNSLSTWENNGEQHIVDAVKHAAKTPMERLVLRQVPEIVIEAWKAERGLCSVIKKGALGLCVFCG